MISRLIIDQEKMTVKRKNRENIFRFIPRRCCLLLLVLLIISPGIFLFYLDNTADDHVVIVHNHTDEFGLYDDDDKPFVCPKDIVFNRTNRQHLVIILTVEVSPQVWANFRSLLCSGVDAYVMLDQVFQIKSNSRGDGFPLRTDRSERSYTHRFLYVTNQYLVKFGVKFMKRLPPVEFTSWDRSIVWLYHLNSFKHAWIIEHDVQWFDVRNMTYLFDHFANDSTDLLCDNIVKENEKWRLWPKSKSDIFPEANWVATFSPFVRWSRQLLLHHYRYMQLIHKDRLRYEIDSDFRFQEFIMGTIAKIEGLSIAVYSENLDFIQIALRPLNNQLILEQLRHGKYILHPVKQRSILTDYSVEQITEMIRTNSPNMTNNDFIKKGK